MIVSLNEQNKDELYSVRFEEISNKLLAIFNSCLEENADPSSSDAELFLNIFNIAYDSNELDPEEFKSKITFSTLQGYFENIEYIKNLGGRYLFMPLTEELFIINLDTRQITVPSHFKKNGIGIVGDDKAEILYFVVDRYYDVMDLYHTAIGIKWTLKPNDGS